MLCWGHQTGCHAPCAPAYTQGTTWGQHLSGLFWGITSVTVSLLDWPLRNLSGGRLASNIRPVRSATAVSGQIAVGGDTTGIQKLA
jgi:hypothetical protein